jgi:hypothetical protein
MEQRLFEDDQMYDVQRQTSGMGSEIVNQGPITVNNIGNLSKPAETKQNKEYPIDAIEQTMGDAFVNVSNVHQLIQIAEQNPTLDKAQLSKLQVTLKGMADLLVDFDETLAKIRGNVK